MDEPLILAEAAWTRLIALTFGPYIMLILGYIFLSNDPVSTTLSIANWETPRPFSPFPILGLVGFLIYTFYISRRFASIIVSRGRYIWIEKGYLMVGAYPRASLLSLAGGTAKSERRIGGVMLYVEKNNGTPIRIRMGVSLFNKVTFLDQLENRIKSAAQDQ